MGLERRLHSLPDGRDLDLVVDDASTSREGFVLVTGAPNGPVSYEPGIDLARQHGLRYLSFARPGYARSTRQPGRAMVDFAADLADVASALGLRRLFLLGWSMGGPHALAAAAALPELVVAAASVVGLAPHREDGIDWRSEIGADRLRDRVDATPAFAADLEKGAAELPKSAEQMRAGLADVVEADRLAATDEVARFMVETMRDGTSSGVWGWHDDTVAVVRPWGVALEAMRVPVTVWHGIDDWLVPVAHARWLAATIPGARLHLFEGEGHISVPVWHFTEIVDELLALGRAHAG